MVPVVVKADSGPVSPDGLRAATQTLRETTKWLIAIFAGLAAILVGGLQFSDLGKLAGRRPQTYIAVAAALVTITAVFAILIAASHVLTSFHPTLRTILVLADRAESRTPHLPASLSEPLIRAIEEERDSLYRGIADDLTDLFARLQDANTATRAPTAVNSDGPGREALDAAVDRVLAFSEHWWAERSFRILMRMLPVAGMITLVGIVAFTFVTATEEPDGIAIREQPVPVEIVLTEEGREWALEVLGCRGPRLRGVAVGGTLDEPTVVTGGTLECKPARFVATHERAIVLPQPP